MGYQTSHRLIVHLPVAEKGNSLLTESDIIKLLKDKTNTPERDTELINLLKRKPLTDKEIIADLRTTTYDARHALTVNGECNEPSKWYKHEDDMKEFSKKYPDVLFEMIGIGEESSDQWKQYFKNGKTQMCKAIMTFPPFDEKKLK